MIYDKYNNWLQSVEIEVRIPGKPDPEIILFDAHKYKGSDKEENYSLGSKDYGRLTFEC